jgi:hypothetical protein
MPQPEQQDSGRTTSPVVVIAAATLACLPILAIAQFIAHARVDELDPWLFAYYGRRLLEGARLYTDIWDNKPPGIFWLNALGLRLAGGSIWGVWLLCAAAAAGHLRCVFCGGPAAVRLVHGRNRHGSRGPLS